MTIILGLVVMLGCMLGISALQVSEYYGNGRPPQPLGSAHPRNAPYQAFRGSDKPFVIAAGNDKLWGEVCEAIGQPALLRRAWVPESLARTISIEPEPPAATHCAARRLVPL